MIKKIATIAGAAALLLGSAAPTLAFRHMPNYDVNNWAQVTTKVEAKADTGDNAQKMYTAGSNYMETGDALAGASANTVVNVFDACGCLPMGDLNNWAMVNTDVKAKADTGDNFQKVWGALQVVKLDRHHHGGGQQQPTGSNMLFTGNATAASEAWTVVNANWAQVAN